MPSSDEAIFKRIPWVDWPSCDPTVLGKRIDNNTPRTLAYHCRRLSCDNCRPVLTVLRARKLLTKLLDEQRQTVWFAEVDQATLDSVKKYAQRHPEEKRLVTLYFDDPDLRTVLATTNMAPRRKGMFKEFPTEQGVIDRWFRYAEHYGLRKNPHDDWRITEHRWVDWVDDGPKWDMVETDQRMDRIHGYLPNLPIEDTEEYKQRFRRIRRDITNPPEATYLD